MLLRKLMLVVMVGILLAAGAPALAAEEEPGVAITIYNNDLAVVKDTRKINLKPGVGSFEFTDVAKRIDATSVHFKSLTDPSGTVVLEQNYDFDLVSANKLLEKFIDKPIEVVTTDDKTYKGVLMSFDSKQLVIQTEDGGLCIVQREDNVRDIRFPKMPEGLLTRPTLVWRISANKGGEHLARVTYMTRGVSWKADYTIVTNEDDTALDLNGWVTINNYSGATYRDALIKLIAGDVNRAQRREWGRLGGAPAESKARGGAGGFVEKSFSEYHMYTLGRPSTVKDNQVKQIEFTNNVGVKCQKIFEYKGSSARWRGYRNTNRNYGGGNKKVNVFIEFDNKKDNNLGIPLPAGKIRVYKKDKADGSLEFIGEDRIDHTPKDEKVKILIGNAFDIVGERKQTDFKRPTEHSIVETYEIKLRNHKEEAATIHVIENLFRWSNWQITEKTDEYEKYDSNTVVFKVKVEPDEEKVITYTVRYDW